MISIKLTNNSLRQNSFSINNVPTSQSTTVGQQEQFQLLQAITTAS